MERKFVVLLSVMCVVCGAIMFVLGQTSFYFSSFIFGVLVGQIITFVEMEWL